MRKKLLTSTTLTAALAASLLAPTAASAATDTTQTVVPFGSSGWHFYRGTSAPPSNWNESPLAWGTGTAPLGFGIGTGALGTTLPNEFERKPLASYFQKSFELDSVPSTGITLTTWADDGLVVYINGTEAVRKNLRPGVVTHDRTWATAAPQSPRAQADKIVVTIPAESLKTGTNLLSAQAQSNWRKTHNVTFDAQLTTEGSTVSAPPAPLPPTTEPPLAQPPVTAPPASEPPTVDPPVAAPPVTAPPVTKPPAVKPPAVKPPAAKPPVTQPPVTEPPTAQPPAPKPPAVSPPVEPTPAPPAPVPTPPVTAPPSGVDAEWGAPAWQDNFDYVDPATGKPAVDPEKWNVRDRDDLGLLFDTASPEREQVTVDSKGIAHLKGEWLSSPLDRPLSHSGASKLTHKTGYMDHRALRAGDMSYGQKYGRWEIRAKTPTGPKTYGALAAFWLRNDNSGEIDIMEAWGYNEEAAPGGQRIDTSTTTVHTKTSGDGNEKFFWHHADGGVTSKPWDGFHTYAFELTPTYAAVFVDDKKVATATPDTHPNLWNEEYFGSPLHVRLNLHVGPSDKYWGFPDPAHRDWTKPLDYQVDYVKIWSFDE